MEVLTTRISECDLFEDEVIADVISEGDIFRMVSDPTWLVFLWKGKFWTQRQVHRENFIAVILPQPRSYHKLGERPQTSFPGAFRGIMTLLTPWFQSLELHGNFYSFKSSVCVTLLWLLVLDGSTQLCWVLIWYLKCLIFQDNVPDSSGWLSLFKKLFLVTDMAPEIKSFYYLLFNFQIFLLTPETVFNFTKIPFNKRLNSQAK